MVKIKIVHIVYSFGIGGLEKGITTLINHGSSEFEHIIVSLTGSGESKGLLTRKTKIFLLNKRDGNSPKFIWELSKLLRQIKPDIVHTRNWSGMDGIFAAKLAGVKTIIHGEHGWDMFDPFGSSMKRRLIRRFSSTLVQDYTCVSKQLKNWLLNDVKIGKEVTQIYNGIDTVKHHPAKLNEKNAIKQQLGFSKDNFIVGIVGRLDAIKNHSNLFKAFKIVIQKNPFARLVIVGDGNEMQRLTSESFQNIVFLGYRPDTDVLMRSFDLFVLPSFNEGISNTILEAMACGLPVIASDAGGNPELVEDGETGFLIDPDDLEQIADKIIKYIKEPSLMDQHGETGRKKTIDNFSIASMVDNYESVYKTVFLP
ncbi:glycosyltransferase [Desulfobacula sp.]|uniref:glycosyltransferase n=1 Tax=Desulfobacula sp. TaxID=2593537 RepID=UPI002606FCA5|nr:glycosyltransferase [Desulfobacula sp.]